MRLFDLREGRRNIRGLIMRTPPSFSRFIRVAISLGLFCGLSASGSRAGVDEEAAEIAGLADFHGGLVVHVGCGDGKLTAAMRLNEHCIVQGVEKGAKRVEKARAAILDFGVYGAVSVVGWNGKKLPYIDNLATLVVCEDASIAPTKELLRVVRPYGALAVKRDGRWTVTVKPKLKGADEWEQHYHGADNNAVADDTLVGPPRRYQWLAEPEWQRSHLALPSMNSMVTAKGRLFTVEDMASAEHPALPGKYALVARDAYNGIVLWRVMFPDWHPIHTRDKEMPVQIQRRLAVVGDSVFCTPGYSAPVTEFNAATGAVVRKHEGTAGTMEFVHDRGVLLVVTGDQSDVAASIANPERSPLNTSRFRREAYGPRIEAKEHPNNDILAVDSASGKELWKLTGAATAGYQGATLGAIGGNVVFSTADELVCVDRLTGRESWRVPVPITLKGPSGIAVSLVLSAKSVFLADSARLRAFRLKDGKALWEKPATINHHKPADVFVANGVVWAAAYNASTGRPQPGLGLGRMGVNGFDALTGEVVKELDQKMTGPMGHDRCYRNRITTKYYINSVSGGSDFLGMSETGESPNPWIRSTCGIGPLPANGLYYVGPPSCACCNSVMLNGLNAMATDPVYTNGDAPADNGLNPRLEKGPAYAAVAKSARPTKANDWPAYRHDNSRAGRTDARVPAKLKRNWETKLGSRVSAPVIADGRLFAADVEGHAVCALDAADGKVLWRFTAEGRVDSPPTYHEGRLLFGSRDGSVYCVRASDGALAWRFLPRERRWICAYEQPESAWPVCGSILIRDGLAYFAAGRNTFIDGGIYLFALNARTGEIVHQNHAYGPYGDNGFPVENREVVKGMSIEGFKGDIFLADDDLLYLRHQAFKPDLTPVALPDVKNPHLITSHGFLEAVPQHRSFWTIDTMLHYDIPTGAGGVHGDILCMDGKSFYEVRGYTPGRTTWFDPRANGYTLYAGRYDVKAKAAEEAKKTPAQKAGKKGAKAKRRGKKVVPTAPSEKIWASSIPLTGKAIALAEKVLFVAGTPLEFPEDDLAAGYEGRLGGVLWAASTESGEKLAEYKLDAAPAWDGLAAANGSLFMSLADGRVVCMAP